MNFLRLICINWVPRDRSTMFLATIFTKKAAETSGFMHSSILMLGNISYYHFTRSGLNSQKIVDLLQLSLGPCGPTILTKFTIFLWIRSFSGKMVMLSNLKQEEYLESELLGIIRVKIVAKNILLGSLGTQHQAVLAIWCLLLKKHTNFLNQNCYI